MSQIATVVDQQERAWDRAGFLVCGALVLEVDALTQAAADAQLRCFGRELRIVKDHDSGHIIPLNDNRRIMSRDQFRDVVAQIEKFYDEVGSDDRVASANQDMNVAELLTGLPTGAWHDHRDEPGWVYVLHGHGFHKIGKTGNLDVRVRQLSTANPCELEVLFAFKVSDCGWLESALHERFAEHRVRGEWFSLPESAHVELTELEKRLVQNG